MGDTNDRKDSQQLAQDRTDWAEDRTMMANERTFAGWMRTGLAAIGIGIGFNALFGKWEPAWAPKAIASIFMAVGIFIIYAAQKRGCAVQERLDAHDAEPVKGVNLRLIAAFMGLGGLCLLIGIWVFEF